MHRVFPFSALVGQEKMKLALILNAINPRIGGVLIRGDRGTAKSTAVRALGAVLPTIKVIGNCPFACDPAGDILCDKCAEQRAQTKHLPISERKVRLVNLPVNTTEDRLIGSMSIESAIQNGEKIFEPGLLALAHRGILFVDEVNLLDRHIMDLLLDSAAMGVNRVEREGISFQHQTEFILIGTMNPEEGELRPQILDRFGLAVQIQGLEDPSERIEILQRCLEFEDDPDRFILRWQMQERELALRITNARQRLPRVIYSRADLATIAEVVSRNRVDGHRADLVILQTARTNAVWLGRDRVLPEDIQLAAEFALLHRIGGRQVPRDKVRYQQENIKEAEGPSTPGDESSQSPPKGSEAPAKKASSFGFPWGKDHSSVLPAKAEQSDNRSSSSSVSESIDAELHPVSGYSPVVLMFNPLQAGTPWDRITRHSAGKRSVTRTERKRGRYIRSRELRDQEIDLAFDATLRQAAPYQRSRLASNLAVRIERQDLRSKVRVGRTCNLILFALDASTSMNAEKRMQVTRGTIFSLLADAYIKRDQVGLIAFQHKAARVVLPPTSSVDLATKALANLPVGGMTPLSAGLLLSYELIKRERLRKPEILPLMVVITDGGGNVAMTDLSPEEETKQVAQMIRSSCLPSIVINTSFEQFDVGHAQLLANWLGCPCYTLRELQSSSLYQKVKQVIGKR